MRDFEERKAEVFRRSEDRIVKRKRIRKRVIAWGLVLCLVITVCARIDLPGKLANLSGTAIELPGLVLAVKAESLMDGIKPQKIKGLDDLGSQNPVVTDFAVRLFKASLQEGENVLISPLSVLSALAMTVNGAEGDTRKQMEETLGMSAEELNLYFYSYMRNLPKEKRCKLSLANSIWFADDESFSVNQDFLQTNANYYGADIYKTAFDEQTLKDINNWVKYRTNDMIPEILDRIPESALMYLVNALSFEGEWFHLYAENMIQDGKFTKEDGTKQTASFMKSTEHVYLEDENATGFMKYYRGGKYAFVAMLPNEGVSVADYVASLDGAALNALLANPQDAAVYATLPKFETEYSTDMAAVLQSMGMTDAFNGSTADFSGIGTSKSGNIYISRVLHKTYICVDEKGTKAGAATAVEMMDGSSINLGPKRVTLNRPFVYMIVDCENNIPFFIGTMMDIEK